MKEIPSVSSKGKKWSKINITSTRNINVSSWALPRQLVTCKLCFHIFRVLVSASYNAVISVSATATWLKSVLLTLSGCWTNFPRFTLQGQPTRFSFLSEPRPMGMFSFKNGFFCRSCTSAFPLWPLQVSIPMQPKQSHTKVSYHHCNRTGLHTVKVNLSRPEECPTHYAPSLILTVAHFQSEPCFSQCETHWWGHKSLTNWNLSAPSAGLRHAFQEPCMRSLSQILWPPKHYLVKEDVFLTVGKPSDTKSMHICSAHFSKYGHRMPSVKRKSHWVISSTQPAYLVWPTPNHSRGIHEGGCGGRIAVEEHHEVLAPSALRNFILFYFLFVRGVSDDIVRAVLFPYHFSFLNDCHKIQPMIRELVTSAPNTALCILPHWSDSFTFKYCFYKVALWGPKKKQNKRWKHLPSRKQ